MITDLTPYRKYVDQFDLTDEEKLELVNALWLKVESIYDQHLGVNQLKLNNNNHQKTLEKEVPTTILTDEPPAIFR